MLQIFYLLLLTFYLQSLSMQDYCETILTNIHFAKDDYDEFGQLHRTCSGEISVNKCEGGCTSQTRPSIHSITGLQNKCLCCMETDLRERLITLENCHDAQSVRLVEDSTKTMTTLIKEPIECKCYKCTN